MASRAKYFAFRIAAIFLGLVAGLILVLAGAKLYDVLAGQSSGPGEIYAPGAASTAWAPTRESTELYPYDGWHTLSDFDWRGEMYGHAAHVKSGSHGFYVDFDLDHPPAKEADEFRIILTGGSAAQGFHGSSNDKMFYSILEQRLNKTFNPQGIRIRLINLAMASTTTYQNFIALNRWGHALEPDLIMSYSGRNEIVLPRQPHGLFAPYTFEAERGLASLARLDLSPSWLKRLHEFFPHVIVGMDYFSMTVRLLNVRTTMNREMTKYDASYRAGPSPDAGKIMIDQYVDALESIKRDFQGIPILVVYQPTLAFADTYYKVFRAAADQDLKGYMNDDWYFFDLQAAVEERKLMAKVLVPGDDCHATDEGHVIISDILEPYLTGLARTLMARRSAEHPGAAPVPPQ